MVNWLPDGFGWRLSAIKLGHLGHSIAAVKSHDEFFFSVEKKILILPCLPPFYFLTFFCHGRCYLQALLFLCRTVLPAVWITLFLNGGKAKWRKSTPSQTNTMQTFFFYALRRTKWQVLKRTRLQSSLGFFHILWMIIQGRLTAKVMSSVEGGIFL